MSQHNDREPKRSSSARVNKTLMAWLVLGVLLSAAGCEDGGDGFSIERSDSSGGWVTITSPADNITTGSAALRLAGDAFTSPNLWRCCPCDPGVKVTWSNAATRESGQAESYWPLVATFFSYVCLGSHTWSTTVTLTVGPNPITVTARDPSGRTGSRSVTVTYDPAFQDPTIAIVQPSTPAFVAAASPVAVSGTATDAARVTWSNMTTGTSGTASGTQAWTASVGLVPGENRITVTAITAAGRTAAVSVTVTLPGTVRAWGENAFGQLGNGTGTASATPVLVNGITTARGVAAGYAHTCAVLTDGSVRCWGNNTDGQLGNGTSADSRLPVTVSTLATATSIAAGASHSCAVMADRTVRCWGRNDSGQLGSGMAGSSAVPVLVVGVPPVASVATGAAHTCAKLADEDRIVCWGANGFGQLGVSGMNIAIAVATGPYHSCVVLRDRSVMCSGLHGLAMFSGSIEPMAVSGINTAVAITAGGPTSQSRPAHTLVLLEDGTVRAWGDNSFGQLGDGTFSRTSIPVPVKGLTTAVAVATGEDHSCALLANSSVSCWGRMVDGPVVNTPRPVGLTGITAIAAGGSHTVARQ